MRWRVSLLVSAAIARRPYRPCSCSLSPSSIARRQSASRPSSAGRNGSPASGSRSCASFGRYATKQVADVAAVRVASSLPWHRVRLPVGRRQESGSFHTPFEMPNANAYSERSFDQSKEIASTGFHFRLSCKRSPSSVTTPSLHLQNDSGWNCAKDRRRRQRVRIRLCVTGTSSLPAFRCVSDAAFHLLARQPLDEPARSGEIVLQHGYE